MLAAPTPLNDPPKEALKLRADVMEVALQLLVCLPLSGAPLLCEIVCVCHTRGSCIIAALGELSV